MGCESPKTSVNVNIKPLPTATISGNSSIFQYDSTQVNISFTGDAPWTFTLSNNKNYSTANATTNIYVKPLKSTTYSLQSVKNVCGFGTLYGTSNITVMSPLAVQEQEQGVNIYPNPVNDKLTVDIQLNRAEVTTLSIFDASGRLIFLKKTSGTESNTKEIIDFNELTSGMYFLKIDFTKSQILKKIFKN